MVKKRSGRRKHVPMRMCVVCRESFPKRSLFRIVATPEEGLVVDTTGKLSGRGAYLCPQLACRQKALAANNNILAQALRRLVSAEEKAALLANWESQTESSVADQALAN